MDTWWIDKPVMLGSSNPTSKLLRQLQHEGFRVIISLLEEHEQEPVYNARAVTAWGYVRHNIPVRDWSPPSVEQLTEFLAIVARDSSHGKIIVHCQGGSGRTGTMAAAYWIQKGLSVEAAIRWVRQAKDCAIQTRSQEQILYHFAQSLQIPRT